MSLRLRVVLVSLLGYATVGPVACTGAASTKDAGVASDRDGAVATEEDASAARDAASDDAPREDADGCSYPGSSSSFCTLCQGYWYCPDGTRTVACPTSTYGNSCDYDSGTGYCLACLSEYAVMASCTCIHNATGNYSDGDGGEDGETSENLRLPDGGEAPLTWNCIDSGEACVPP